MDPGRLDDPIERQTMPPDGKITRRDIRRRMRYVKRKETAAEALEGTLPGPGESTHYIQAATYDFFHTVPAAVGILGEVGDLYASTWTMSRNNVLELFEIFDGGKIKRISVLTGNYFKRRESAVYARLLEGLQRRGQRYAAFGNHTKIVLMDSPPDYIVMEGSANFTSNPRLENYIIVNDRALWDFHREWMEGVFNGR